MPDWSRIAVAKRENKKLVLLFEAKASRRKKLFKSNLCLSKVSEEKQISK